MSAPYVLRPYQRRYIEDTSPVRLVVKSRRIGMTYCDACEATITAAMAPGSGGMDTWYSAQTFEDTKEYAAYVKGWAQRLGVVAEQVDGSQFLNPDDPNAAGVSAVRFASGHKVVTMTSNPRSIHGKQGRAVLDEAARYDAPNEFLEAALPLLMLGGRVSLISTESHTETEFHKRRLRIKAGDPELEDWSLHECFFDQALAEGFYRWHVMPRLGLDPAKDWTPELEADYRAQIRRQQGEHAASQLDGIPVGADDLYLDRQTIEACTRPGWPVFRYKPPPEAVAWDRGKRVKHVEGWLDANVDPALADLDHSRPHAAGIDFGRASDITSIAPVFVRVGLERVVPFMVEMRNTPFEMQEQVFAHVISKLPRLHRVVIDAGGPGADVSERLLQRFGAQIRRVHIGTAKARTVREQEEKPGSVQYAEMLPPLKAALQQGRILLPADDLVVSDLMGLRLVEGMPRVPSVRSRTADGPRHCDAAVSTALALWAARNAGARVTMPTVGASSRWRV